MRSIIIKVIVVLADPGTIRDPNNGPVISLCLFYLLVSCLAVKRNSSNLRVGLQHVMHSLLQCLSM